MPTTPYPTQYNDAFTQARQELNSNARPVLSSHNANMDSYDTIYLGFPIWHGNTPMVIRTFLEEYDFSGKTIAPFATSGSSGMDAAVSAIRTLCSESKVTEGLSIPSALLPHTEDLVDSWIKRTNALDGGGTSTPSVPASPPSTTPIPTPDPNPDLGKKEDAAMPKLTIQIGSATFTATLKDNATTRALMMRLPMTITMGELNGNEKYYYLPSDLPTDSQRPGTIRAGDLMLYGSDCMVLFYETFPSAYSYTRLGSIDEPAGLAAALGGNNVELTIRVS